MRWARTIAATLVIASLAGATVAALSSAPGGRAPRGSAPATPATKHAPSNAAPAAAPGARLPAGGGRDIAERGCVICHSAMLIAQQHKDSTGWEKTVSLMQKWGAPVQAAERDTLMTYLLGSFGPARAH